MDPLEEWQLVGDAYYSRRLLYDLAWGGGGSGGAAAFDLAFMRCVAGRGSSCFRCRCRGRVVSDTVAAPVDAGRVAIASPPLLPPCSVFPASAGGPVAALRDDTKVAFDGGTLACPGHQLCRARGCSAARRAAARDHAPARRRPPPPLRIPALATAATTA